MDNIGAMSARFMAFSFFLLAGLFLLLPVAAGSPFCTPEIVTTCGNEMEEQTLPECLTVQSEKEVLSHTHGICGYGVHVENGCNEIFLVEFYCHEEEEYCPKDETLEPGGILEVEFDDGQFHMELEPITMALRTVGEVDESTPAVTFQRTAERTNQPTDAQLAERDGDDGDDDGDSVSDDGGRSCGASGGLGCNAAGGAGAPQSFLLVFAVLFIGLAMMRRRPREQ